VNVAFSGRIPTIASIQRTNLLVLVITAGVLAGIYTTASAIACLLGGVVVIGNLYLLGMLGRFALAAAEGGGSGAKLGLAALPLKLLIVAGLVYLLFSSLHIDGLGFGLGVLTQVTAIIIETGRAAFASPR
jgi:hypothetical protein